MQLMARDATSGAVSVALRDASRQALALPPGCTQAPLPLDSETSGTWDTGCASVSRPGSNAQYYTISVPTSEVITISVASTTDSYVVLHAGPAPGSVLAFDDNAGPGTDALMASKLPAGTYTIEATTALTGKVATSPSLPGRTRRLVSRH
jgi:hypothetical protein